MRKIGLIAGLLALLGLLFFTVMPTVMGYSQPGITEVCGANCLASGSVLGETPYVPSLMILGLAGVLAGSLYFRGRQPNIQKPMDESSLVCGYCNNKIDPDWRLCPFCGQSITE